MDAVKLCALGLLCLMALLVLRQWRPEWAPLLRLTAIVVLGGALVGIMGSALSVIRGWSEGILPETVWSLMTKALGLAVITEMAAGICRDSGEMSLASWIETAGKLEILLLALPLAEDVLHVAKELMGV